MRWQVVSLIVSNIYVDIKTVDKWLPWLVFPVENLYNLGLVDRTFGIAPLVVICRPFGA